MWDEIKGLLLVFILIPLALGLAYCIAAWAITGDWPDMPPAGDCYTDWDGRSNPTVCER